MAPEITRIGNEPGGIRLDFGTIEHEPAHMKNGEIVIMDYAEHALHIFNCAWRAKKDRKILFTGNDFDTDIDILPLVNTGSPLYLKAYVEINSGQFIRPEQRTGDRYI